MQGTSGNRESVSNRPRTAESGMALGRCLVEGDPEANSSARRSRGKSFGVSLTIELVILTALVIAPLLTSSAQMQLHQILPPQIAFFGVWREHPPSQPLASPTTAHNPVMPTPYPTLVAPVNPPVNHYID